jgi:hypothetical protein
VESEKPREGHLTDRDRLARRDRVERERQERIDKDLRAVMATPEGRRVVFWLVDELAGLAGDRGFDAESRAVDSGRRAVGRDLVRRLGRVAPQDWVSAYVEAWTDRQERDSEAR